MKVFFEHPDVHDAAVEAANQTAEKLKGLENRDIPPAPAPSCKADFSPRGASAPPPPRPSPPIHHFSTLLPRPSEKVLLSLPAANDSERVLRPAYNLFTPVEATSRKLNHIENKNSSANKIKHLREIRTLVV